MKNRLNSRDQDRRRIAELEAENEALRKLLNGWRLRAHRIEDELVSIVSSSLEAPIVEISDADEDADDPEIEGVAV